MTNLGGWFMYLALKQQEAEREADWRELEAEAEAERRHDEAELAADERHAELVETMLATAPMPPEPAKVPAAAYLGPGVDVAVVGRRDLSAEPLPATAEALRDEVQPLNLIVGGGDEDAGWAVAQAVQGLLGGRMVGLRLGGLREKDLAMAVTSLDDDDVLVIPTIEDASGEAIRCLQEMLGPDSRKLSVTIGSGPSARTLTLTLPQFAIVAHTSSGRIPAPLVEWGGRLSLPKDTKTCPDCAEEVKAAARICRFCRYDFEPVDVTALWDDLPSDEGPG